LPAQPVLGEVSEGAIEAHADEIECHAHRHKEVTL
jgi:hypothetical protein